MDAEDAHPLESRPPTRDDLLLICRSLNSRGARYLVIGGFAIIAQGFTRATEDIDLLIEDSSANLEKVRAALQVLPDQAVREVTDEDCRGSWLSQARVLDPKGKRPLSRSPGAATSWRAFLLRPLVSSSRGP